ncbi:fumarylacetoacetate hydrolase family protein [Thioalkalivibrio sp. XN8]|uniref:fumarylacetoacetate hydrolase family protein n=1 Tax=Thioalkalivibrio sp. XN8 TaxID=2712863 RepID=UPI0013EB4CE6|nr:fumarylacetoacetate hydrolase family protein [Thioalkalivibrio sp. XN8]NGP53966.1 fumarylacetoacetate hydrolase family protein [Thioalkalivibrio sp. XN8]
MKLATLKQGGRDGTLVVASRDLARAVPAAAVAPTLQAALDDWQRCRPLLEGLAAELERGAAQDAFDLAVGDLAAPLPRAYQFLDGSAYLAHVERVRRARGAEMPPSFLTDPLMYQAVSDGFLPPVGAIPVPSEDYGIDFESEVCVVTSDVPMGVSAAEAADYVQLVCLVNDVSLRNLIPAELAKGFGFLQSKPRSALSPVMVTPAELGEAWRDGKVHLPLVTTLDGEQFGAPEAGVDMQFSFFELIAHAARTRPLAAGTIVGSGTVANQDESLGASCMAEKRMLEIIRDGKPSTPFLSFGARVRVEMFDRAGHSIFGAIEHVYERYQR